MLEYDGEGANLTCRRGRSTSPSLATIDALATALALDPVERAHLRRLAKADRPAPFVREKVPPRVRRMVESLRQPAYVTGRRWDVLAWNRAADDLIGLSKLDVDDRNILVSVLTLPAARRLFGARWESEAKRIVARFRADYDVWADDPAFVSLLERLRAGCPELARWWNAHDVHGSHSGDKVMVHPKRGELRFGHTSFQSNDDPALRLVVLTPVDAPRPSRGAPR